MGLFGRFSRHFTDLAALALAVWVQLQLRRWLLESEAARRSKAVRWWIQAGSAAVIAWVILGFATSFPSAYRLMPASAAVYWVRGAALAWAIASLGVYLVLLLLRRTPHFSAKRRGFVRIAGNALVAAPLAVMGFGVLVERRAFRVREVDVPIPNLPPDLNGLRLVQLSDIHMGPFLSERELERAVAVANEQRAHIALVTGDLITSHGDPLDACLRQLARLRADAGIFGCLGNHEIYARCEDATTRRGARLGLAFLRQQARALRFGSATLNIVGVDYQRMGTRHLVDVERLVAPGATNVLLSHNPNSFDAAVEKGFDLTVSGHTHGGQIAVEILGQTLSAAQFVTPYVYGMFRKGPAALWVTRGLGTVGVPARIGAPPEIAVIRLCAI